MAAIFNIPQEVVTQRVFPLLNVRATQSFGHVSRAAYAIVQLAATEAQDNITLAGERVSIVLDGTVAAFFRHKLKMDILTTHPELLERLKMARSAVNVSNGNPDDLSALIKHAKGTCQTNLMLAIIPFDLDGAKLVQAGGVCGLGDALLSATDEKNPELIEAILSHPNAIDIQAGGFLGLGNALIKAISAKNTQFVRAILSHPNAKDIDAECFLVGLGFALEKAIKAKSLELVKMILSHPNAAKIPATGFFGLGNALVKAVREKSLPLVQATLSHPNAAKIPAEDRSYYDLKSALEEAKHAKCPELVKEILAHPNAKIWNGS